MPDDADSFLARMRGGGAAVEDAPATADSFLAKMRTNAPAPAATEQPAPADDPKMDMLRNALATMPGDRDATGVLAPEPPVAYGEDLTTRSGREAAAMHTKADKARGLVDPKAPLWERSAQSIGQNLATLPDAPEEAVQRMSDRTNPAKKGDLAQAGLWRTATAAGGEGLAVGGRAGFTALAPVGTAAFDAAMQTDTGKRAGEAIETGGKAWGWATGPADPTSRKPGDPPAKLGTNETVEELTKLGLGLGVAHLGGAALEAGGDAIAKTPLGDVVTPRRFQMNQLREARGADLVLGSDGEPVVVHHGTGADFDRFDPATKGDNTGAPSARAGYFFSESPDTAGRYMPQEGGADGKSLGDGANIRRSHLRMKNPLVVDMKGVGSKDWRKLGDPNKSFKTIIDRAKADGHDGVILKNTYDGGPKDNVYVTFDPGQEINLDRFGMGGEPVPEESIAPRLAEKPAPKPDFGEGLDAPPPETPVVPVVAAPQKSPEPAGSTQAAPSRVPGWMQENAASATKAVNPDVVMRIEDLAAEGRTAKEIAKATGLDVEQVLQVRVDRGIPARSLPMQSGESPEFTAWKAKRQAPPREGPTLGANRLVTGKQLRQAEGTLDAADQFIAKHVAKPIAGMAKKIPGAKPLYDKVFSSAERAISPEFESAVMEGRKVGTGLAHEADTAVRGLKKATKGLDEGRLGEIGRSLSSEPSDLSTLAPETRKVVEGTRSSLQSMREREVGAGTLSPEAFGEYPQGHLTRIPKPGIVASIQRQMRRVGNQGVGPYKMAKDMHSVELKLSADEARALVPADAPLRYLKEHGEKTLLQFSDSPEGKAARDAFIDNVKEKFGEARSKLGADATREIEAGDVQQSKMLMKAQLDTPRMKELGVEVSDPIPADVAKRTFMGDPTARLHRTMHESASRLGRREALKRISEVVDDKGPIVKEPKDAGRAARGEEPSPDGYEFVSSENLHELQGKFVRSDAAKYVRGAFAADTPGFFKGISSGLMERFKVGALLYSPRQAFRQLVSNMEFENLAGMSNWNPRYVAHKLRGLKAMSESSPYYKDLVAERLLQTSFVSPEELGLATKAFEGPGTVGQRIGRAVGSFGMTEIAPRALGKLESGLGKLYGAADAWTKSTIYTYAIEDLDMSPKDAANYTRKWTPSPESVSELAKAYSRHIVGDPWARYKLEQGRILGSGLEEKPIRTTMNLYQKSLIRGAAMLLGASALTDDEEKAKKAEQGEGAIALGRNEKGDPLSLDYSFLSTIGDWRFDTPSEVGKPGEHTRERFMDITGLADNPGGRFIFEQASGRDLRTGQKINPEGTEAGLVKTAVGRFFDMFTPRLATIHAKKLVAAWKGEPYSLNQPAQTKAQAVCDVFFGFKLSPLDADKALLKIRQQGARALNDIEHDAKSRVLHGEDIDMDRVKALAEALKKEYDERAAPLEKMQERK